MASSSSAPDASEDESEVPPDFISPNADVFSYFMLTSPSEMKKHKRFTMDAFMSYALVFLVLFIQGVLLYCVSDKVVKRNIKWQNGILNTGHGDWNLIGVKASSGCNDGKSMCTRENGTFTCAPPSVQLVGRWDALDTNKDGTWSRDEVMKSREDIMCKYAVDPLEVFNVVASLLADRSQYVWIHPDVTSGKAINKVYFDYIKGDITMCGYRNGDMCSNLVQRGFFDAAIRHGTVPRVGTSVKSALDYCHALLDQGGLCERILPSTYSTWKIESVQECQDAEYETFVYKDPSTGFPKSLLSVDYEARQKYETAKTPIFKIYKICIIFLWMLLIVSQLREVSKSITWVVQLPLKHEHTAEEEELEAAKATQSQALKKQRSELHSNDIKKISWRHRLAFGIVTVIRICMLCVLMYVGLNFLGRQTNYIGLLMDGVALIFIVEVEEIIYARVLRQEVRTLWEERDPVELKKNGWLAAHPDISDCAWLCFVGILAIVFLMYYTAVLVEPLYDSLQCACLSEGEKCREAAVFSGAFWDQYWQHDVPNAIEGIKKLKTGLPINFWMEDLKHHKPLPLLHSLAQVAPHIAH